MNCNGRMSALRDDVHFELIVFGSTQKGKIDVKSKYLKKDKAWIIKELALFTKEISVKII